MSFSPVNNASGTTSSISYAPAQGGNLLVLAARVVGGSAPSITDGNNTWIPVISSNPLGPFHVLYYVPSCSASAISATISGGGAFFQWVLSEYSGSSVSAIVEQTSSNFVAASSSTIQPGHILPAQNNELVVTVVTNDAANGQSYNVDSGFTIRNNAAGNVFLADSIQTTAVSTNPTWTDTTGANTNQIALIACFQASSTAPATHTLGVWTNQGVVIAPVSSDQPGQPNVFYEAAPNPSACGLTPNGDGNLFKMWFSTKAGLCYAESNNGTSWTRYASNPVISCTATPLVRIFKNAGTYYVYGNIVSGPTAMDVYTSTDGGITWAQAKVGALALGGSGNSWEVDFIGQLAVVGKVGSLWYGYFGTALNSGGEQYVTGQATSSDLINWTQTASGPYNVLPGNYTFLTIGNAIYGWTQIVQAGIPAYGSQSLPSDIGRVYMVAPDSPSMALLPVSAVCRTTAAEGVGTTIGQVADPSIINVDGTTYLYATVAVIGVSGIGPYQIGCWTTSLSELQIIQTNEGVVDVPHASSSGFAEDLNTLVTDQFTIGDANWAPLTTNSGYTAPTFGTGYAQATTATVPAYAYYKGFWNPDQWASVTLGAFASTSFNSVFARMSNAGVATYYGFSSIGTTACVAFKVINGVSTTLATIVTTMHVGDVLTISAIGTQISFYLNANLLFTVSDSSVASGSPGIGLQDSSTPANSKISSFSAGNFLFSIGGNAGIAGTSVSDGTNAVTVDASGNFVLSGEIGAKTITPSKTGYTFSPTSANETVSGADITGVNFTATQTLVATPTFSPVAGTYTSTQNVIISSTDSALAGFAMYYTTDGSTPTTGATLYVAPVSISVTSTLKAIAVATGYANSAVGSAAYVINLTPLHYSVPDDRNYGNFPNLPVNVQGTLTYTTPSVYSLRYWFDTLFGRTQSLPLDSRISKPTDSRVAGTTPQNSRTPGTFGPGE